MKLNLPKEVRHLGVILDDKLRWKAQVKKGAKGFVVESTSEKGAKGWLSNAFVGKTWGLSPKMALWLYKRVIIFKITYAAVAWWDRMDIVLARSELERLQRAACIMIIGTMRTTPTRVLEMFLDLPTLGTAM